MNDQFYDPTGRNSATQRTRRRLAIEREQRIAEAKSTKMADPLSPGARKKNWEESFSAGKAGEGFGNAPKPVSVSPSNPRVTGNPTEIKPYKPDQSQPMTNARQAADLAEIKRQVAPGGMGNVSYTQNQQASAPMTPRIFNPTQPKPVTLAYEVDPRVNSNANLKSTVRPDGVVENSMSNKYGSGTGVANHPNKWQIDIVKAHPEIGIAGSKMNTAFVDAFNKSGRDPMKAADIANTVRLQHEATATQATPTVTPAQIAANNQGLVTRMDANRAKNYRPTLAPKPAATQANMQVTPEQYGAEYVKEFKRIQGEALAAPFRAGAAIGRAVKGVFGGGQADPSAPAAPAAAPAPTQPLDGGRLPQPTQMVNPTAPPVDDKEKKRRIAMQASAQDGF